MLIHTINKRENFVSKTLFEDFNFQKLFANKKMQ